MENQTFEKVRTILKVQLDQLLDGKDITINDELTNIGINSLLFIKTIVAMEKEFDIEFQDEDLDVSKYRTVDDIVKYIDSKTVQK